ncbi:MAG: hypothetical protein GX331_09285 [Firmicutes bacterium]|nr:hypothetical protein [Bacillota bacterium]
MRTKGRGGISIPHTRDFLGRKGYKEPERMEEGHRPKGSPVKRESQSQDVQMETLPHPDNREDTRSGVETRKRKREPTVEKD